VAEEKDKKAKKKELTTVQRRKLSPRKRVRQNVKRNARNRARKEEIKIKTKAFAAALAKGDVADAEQKLREATATLMSVGTKSTMHRKTAARKRSRLALRLNAAKAKA
jgi:small subunit ribosomal protein S20